MRVARDPPVRTSRTDVPEVEELDALRHARRGEDPLLVVKLDGRHDGGARRGRQQVGVAQLAHHAKAAFARERVENGTETLEVVARAFSRRRRRAVALEPAVPTSNLRIQPLRAGEVAHNLVALAGESARGRGARASAGSARRRRAARLFLGRAVVRKVSRAFVTAVSSRRRRPSVPRKGSFAGRRASGRPARVAARRSRAELLRRPPPLAPGLLGPAPRIMSIELVCSPARRRRGSATVLAAARRPRAPPAPPPMPPSMPHALSIRTPSTPRGWQRRRWTRTRRFARPTLGDIWACPARAPAARLLASSFVRLAARLLGKAESARAAQLGDLPLDPLQVVVDAPDLALEHVHGLILAPVRQRRNRAGRACSPACRPSRAACACPRWTRAGA